MGLSFHEHCSRAVKKHSHRKWSNFWRCTPGAPEINGWNVTITYDQTQVSYVTDSFQPSDFLPGLIALHLPQEGSIGLGGVVLTSDTTNSGDGFLGTLSFEVLEGFTNSTDLVITEVGFSLQDEEDIDLEVFSMATITREHPPCPGDFNGDGIVDFADFFIFADNFGRTDCRVGHPETICILPLVPQR